MRIETNSRKFNNLVFGRLITIIAVQMFLISFTDTLGYSEKNSSLNYVTILTLLALFSLPLIFKAAKSKFESRTTNILIVLFDSLYIAILVHLTGGTSSPFTLLLPFYIFVTSYTLGSKGIIISGILSQLIIISAFFISSDTSNFKTLILLSIILAIFVFTIYFFGSQYNSCQQDVSSINKLNNNIINNLKIGVIILDKDSRVLSINKYAQMITRNKLDIKNNIDELKEAGSIEPHKLQIDEKNYLSVQYLETFKSDFIVIKDISEDVIQEINEQEYEKLKLIGSITTILAHEIKNPVASLIGAGELIDKNPEILANKDQSKKLLGIIARETTRLNNLVEEFLMFSSPDKRNNARIDLLQLLSSCCDSIQTNNVFIEKKLSIDFIHNSEQYLTSGDYHRLSQCFDNLLINATHASPHKAKIKCTLNNTDNKYFEIIIEDTGQGIPIESRQKIFEPFFTTKKQGTGLGLAIVNNIIKAHNGKIEILDSQQGATFCIKLAKGDINE